MDKFNLITGLRTELQSQFCALSTDMNILCLVFANHSSDSEVPLVRLLEQLGLQEDANEIVDGGRPLPADATRQSGEIAYINTVSHEASDMIVQVCKWASQELNNTYKNLENLRTEYQARLYTEVALQDDDLASDEKKAGCLPLGALFQFLSNTFQHAEPVSSSINKLSLSKDQKFAFDYRVKRRQFIAQQSLILKILSNVEILYAFDALGSDRTWSNSELSQRVKDIYQNYLTLTQEMIDFTIENVAITNEFRVKFDTVLFDLLAPYNDGKTGYIGGSESGPG